MDEKTQKQKPGRFSMEDILHEEWKLRKLEHIVNCDGEIMATEEQIAANHKSAAMRGGCPCAGAGKLRPAAKSTKHWWFGEFHLVEGEDPEEFCGFEEGPRTGLKHEGAVEECYVRRWLENAMYP